eukprot:2281973-Alexandrium_andersonii.AAC.1
MSLQPYDPTQRLARGNLLSTSPRSSWRAIVVLGQKRGRSATQRSARSFEHFAHLLPALAQ